MPFRSTFEALRERNYLLFFGGQVVSLTGTWMERAALASLVYELSGHSAQWLGWLGFVPLVPSLLLSIPAGAWADRVPLRPMIVSTQALMMLGSAAMSLWIVLGYATPQHVLVYAAYGSAVFAVDAAARQTFVVTLVRRERLTNAVALNATSFNVARLGGGIAFWAVMQYTELAEAGCLALNALSFGFVIAGLLKIRDRAAPPTARREPLGLLEGLRYCARTPHVRGALLITFILSMFGFQVTHLLPVYAEKVFEAGKPGLGQLHAAAGVGALLGGLTLATRSARVHRGRLVVLCGLAAPFLLTAFAQAPTLLVGMALLGLGGFVLIQAHSAANALIQSTVPDELRGRVMSVYTLSILVSFPLGGLLGGLAADRWGAQFTTLIDAGVILVAVAAVRWTHRALRDAR